MEAWNWVQLVFEMTSALTCVAVAVALFIAVRERRRSTTTNVYVAFAALLIVNGLATLIGATAFLRIAGWIGLVAAAILALVAVVTASLLILTIPRAVEFHDHKHLVAAADELRQCKDRFQRALDGSFCGLWEWNIEANTVWYSSHFKESLGYTPHDYFPNELERWKSALHPDDVHRVLQALDGHLHKQEAYDVEYRLQTKAGDYRWFNARGLAIRHPDGQPYLMSGSIRDIHDHKLAQEAIRRRDEYVSQKQKMEALGQLAGEMAHEFNNLLQAISGQIEFAQRSLPKPSPARHELTFAADLIQQSSKFTRQMLDFGRKPHDGNEAVEVNKLVTNLASVLRSMLSEQIELRVQLGKRAGRVLANKAALQQALLNLCINARDAMPNGGKITVRTRRTRVAHDGQIRFPGAMLGPYATIAVCDNGCGLTEEVKAKIFEPFYTTKSAGKGSGLGLSVVYNSVKAAGGFIEVHSAPGNGSTFTIWLPLTKQSESSALVNRPTATKRPRARNATVLYAEDKDSVRDATTRILKQRGHKVIAATDGQEAMRIFAEHMATIDLALLDAVMPGMGGGAVFQRLREQSPELPIVFCSGYVSQLIGNDILQSDRTWLIDKPFNAETLLETLEHALTAS